MLDRRSFLKTTLTAAGGLAAASAVPVRAQARDTRVHSFTISGISPANNPNSILFKRYLDSLAAASGGRLRLDWVPGGALVPANAALDALSQGTIDMLLSQPSYYAGKVSIGSFTELPFFTSSYRETAELSYNTDILKIVDAVYREKTGTTVIQVRPFNSYVFIMHRDKAIRSVGDIAGKKIRTPGGMVDEIVKTMGGVPVKLVPGEFYQALQGGIVDGFLLPLYALESYKLGELRPVVTTPGTGSLTCQLVWMNLKRWNELPPDLQQLVRTTSLSEIPQMDAFWRAEDEKALAYARKTNVEIIQLSQADQKVMTERSASVVDTFEKREGERGRQLVKILRSKR